MQPLLLLPLLLLSATLLGCRSPGVIQLSPDTYMISKSSAAGAFVNLPKLKAEIIREANAFAISRGKEVQPVSMHDSQPTHGFPSAEYQFRLVDKATNNVGALAPTIGQQLIDLQRAKDAGAITDAEYQTQKARILGDR